MNMENNNNPEKAKRSYIPFVPTPEFWKTYDQIPVEEYIPETTTKNPGSWTKYGYVPTPINKPPTEQSVVKSQVEQRSSKPMGNVNTHKRKQRRLRQLSKTMKPGERGYIHPTRSIGVNDPYWFPVFWNSKRPENEHMEFKKTFVTLADKQRAVVKTYWNGKITVFRAGEEITLRQANTFGIGVNF